MYNVSAVCQRDVVKYLGMTQKKGGGGKITYLNPKYMGVYQYIHGNSYNRCFNIKKVR